jgi:UDP-glucose 4-epimerase
VSESRTTAAVIGGGGLIGAYVVRLLRSERPDWNVRVVDTFTASDRTEIEALRGPQLEILETDVRDRAGVGEAVDGCAVVFHLAALVSSQMRDHLREGIEVDVIGALNVIEAAAAARARLVVSSSITVFGGPEGRVHEVTAFSHQTCPPTSALYGSMKLTAEYACAITAARQPGFSWVALRYATVYGRRQHRRGVHQLNIVDNLVRLRSGDQPRFGGTPDEAHDYVHASDVARANLLAAEAPASATGRAYIVASGRSTTNAQIAAALAEVTGSTLPPIWEESADDQLRVRLRDVSFDISAARTQLGYEPRTTMYDGIADLDAWLQLART